VREGVRVGIGRFNTQAEIDHVAQAMIAAVKKCRIQTPSEIVCEL